MIFKVYTYKYIECIKFKIIYIYFIQYNTLYYTVTKIPHTYDI